MVYQGTEGTLREARAALAVQIRQRDLDDALAKLGIGLNRNRRCACPLHGGENPNSFSVFEGDGGWQWKCHSGDCGSGDLIAFLQKRDGLSFPSALEQAAILVGLGDQVPSAYIAPLTRAELFAQGKAEAAEARKRRQERKAKQKAAEVAAAARERALAKLDAFWDVQDNGAAPLLTCTAEGRAFLDQRCIPHELAWRVGVRSTTRQDWDFWLNHPEHGLTEEEQEAAGLTRLPLAPSFLVLPFWTNGRLRLQAVRFRNLPQAWDGIDSSALPKVLGARAPNQPLAPFLLGNEAPRFAREWGCPLYITEGELDALSVAACELPAVSGWGANSWRAGMAKEVGQVPAVICLADGDEAGKRFGEKVREDFQEMGCPFLLCEGIGAYKDANALLMARGKVGLKSALDALRGEIWKS